MPAFTAYYRGLFSTLGYPLTAAQGTDEAVVARAADRLGIHLPEALLDYYVVAGRERRFSRTQNHLLSPREWRVERGRLIFMIENQAVCLWGASVRKPEVADPKVEVSYDAEDISFRREHARVSTFLAGMAIFQGVSGGFPHLASGAPSADIGRRLRKDWTLYSTMNGERAYARAGQAVLLSTLMGSPQMMAGARTRSGLREIGESLGVELDASF